MASQTKLIDGAESQEPWICRTVRRVTRRTAFGFQRRMFKSKRALFIRMTLKTCGVSASRESCLLEFEAAVRVMTVATLHRSFKNFVVKRCVELRFYFAVATKAELRFARLQHVQG
jgi:hypothetical protein